MPNYDRWYGAITLGEHFRFRFELAPINEIDPWGEPGKAKLHWFGLTFGRYWIETPLGELLRYTPEIQTHWNSQGNYVDYQIARLLEDLQAVLPAVLEPVPIDIAILATHRSWLDRLSHWTEEEESEDERIQRWELYDAAMWWWRGRSIDTAYLSCGPQIWIWRVADTIHFRWTTPGHEEQRVPVFVVPAGDFSMSLPNFKTAAISFFEDVLSTMNTRICDIQREGWSRPGCAINLDKLVLEQRRRQEAFKQPTLQIPTNWGEVRTQLQLLKSKIDSI